jgi:hypothetical protein
MSWFPKLFEMPDPRGMVITSSVCLRGRSIESRFEAKPRAKHRFPAAFRA